MSAPNLILVVDDDFATLDFLRSILELSEGDYDVLGVPSAEEALLALKRAAFDLLVADVKLPGMDGLQLAQQAKELSPRLPVIMITGYDSTVVAEEARRIGVAGYFSKPLDAEDFLAAVGEAIGGSSSVKGRRGVAVDGITGDQISPAIAKRIETLRADIGANQVILAAITGEVLFSTGGRRDHDLQQLVTAIAFSMDSNFHLSDHLGSSQPQAIQYLVGEQNDLYCANIGHDYFIAILFDSQVRRGRIGTVWVFSQRAIKDLRILLAEDQTEGQDESILSTVLDDSSEGYSVEPQAQNGIFDHSSLHTDSEILDDVEKSEEANVKDAEFISSEYETNNGLEKNLLDWAVTEPDGIDLDTLFEGMTGEGEEEHPAISFEEAKRRGLITSDFDQEDE